MTVNIADWDWDEIIAEAGRLWEAGELRREQPWVLHLIKILRPYGQRGLRRIDALYRVEQLRADTGVKMPRKEIDKAAQSAFNRHNGSSQTFELQRDDDLFYAFGRKGERKWAVHTEKIEPWLRKKGLRST